MENKKKDDYEIFWERIKTNDKVLVKAPIQNKVNKKCYFLGTVTATSIHEDDKKHVVVIQLEGETDRRAIKLENIGSIEDVKKTIIPMDFIFKDENIKAGKIEKAEFECRSLDANCDGKTTLEERKGEDDVYDFTQDTDDEMVDVEEDKDATGQGGGKKKKKNRSRSKKNKKKRKRKNSTKKKN